MNFTVLLLSLVAPCYSQFELFWCSLDEPSGVDVEAGAVIHEVLWNTDMHSPMMRKLVNETCCKYALCREKLSNSVAYHNI